MELIPTDDQRAIREQAVRLLADRASSESVRKVIESGQGGDADLWATISQELGWCAMAVPETHDGLGLGVTELLILVESVGERLAPVPLWSTTCVAAPLLDAVGSADAKARLLPRIAMGELAATVAWGQIDTTDPIGSTTVTAEETENGYTLRGTVDQVVDLGIAGLVLIPARLGGQIAVFALLDQPEQFGKLHNTVDGTRQIGMLTFDGAHLSKEARVDENGLCAGQAHAALATAQLGMAAEQIGAARGVMDLTLEYISGRVQFGRTIASFQAIKHRCALLEVDYAEAKALVYGAAANFATAGREERAFEAASARALATDLLFKASQEAIQMHGGVGCTWEYDPQLYFKRAQATACLLGSAEQHRSHIAASFIDREATL